MKCGICGYKNNSLRVKEHVGDEHGKTSREALDHLVE